MMAEPWTVTLNQLGRHKPCRNSWQKGLRLLRKTDPDDEPILLTDILDRMGLNDTFWCLRAVKGRDRELREFACDCAERVLPPFERHHPDDKRPRECIEVARRFARGEASDSELAAAEAAAWAAGREWQIMRLRQMLAGEP